MFTKLIKKGKGAALALLFACLLCAAPAFAEDYAGLSVDKSWYSKGANTYYIATPQAFAGFAKLVDDREANFAGKTVRLAADIDLTAVNWRPAGFFGTEGTYDIAEAGFYFAGTLDGGGHTVKFRCAPDVDDTNKLRMAALFTGLGSAAVVRNLNVEAELTETNGSCYVGALAAWSFGTISNCAANVDISGTVASAGGLAGLNYGLIEDSSVTGRFAITDMVSGGAGGIAGIHAGDDASWNRVSKKTIRNCRFSGTMRASGVGSAFNNTIYFGGIAGQVQYAGSEIRGCAARADILADDEFKTPITAGGIAGAITNARTYSALIANCSFEGKICGTTLGGIFGDGSSSGRVDTDDLFVISDCFASADIILKLDTAGYKRAGGFCGTGGSVNGRSYVFTNCRAIGSIDAQNSYSGSGYSYIGGMIASMATNKKAEVYNCVSDMDIRFTDDGKTAQCVIGGMLGYYARNITFICKNSVVLGDIKITNTNAECSLGGLVGGKATNAKELSFDKCAALGSLSVSGEGSAKVTAGALFRVSTKVTAKDCHWLANQEVNTDLKYAGDAADTEDSANNLTSYTSEALFPATAAIVEPVTASMKTGGSASLKAAVYPAGAAASGLAFAWSGDGTGVTVSAQGAECAVSGAAAGNALVKCAVTGLYGGAEYAPAAQVFVASADSAVSAAIVATPFKPTADDVVAAVGARPFGDFADPQLPLLITTNNAELGDDGVIRAKAETVRAGLSEADAANLNTAAPLPIFRAQCGAGQTAVVTMKVDLGAFAGADAANISVLQLLKTGGTEKLTAASSPEAITAGRFVLTDANGAVVGGTPAAETSYLSRIVSKITGATGGTIAADTDYYLSIAVADNDAGRDWDDAAGAVVAPCALALYDTPEPDPTPSNKSSSGGCNAGAPLPLLAAAAIVMLSKKR